ncbi:hypothetical protein STAPHY8AQ_20270 [Staphylococcus sp. 8AQ]|nr:hypothetical protein STAPHY8AQ_20270 [Staphylococcus sp. 8AQ]
MYTNNSIHIPHKIKSQFITRVISTPRNYTAILNYFCLYIKPSLDTE